MARKKVKINPECAKRLKQWLEETNVTQTELSQRTHYTQQYISNIIRGKKAMTVDFAKAVENSFLLYDSPEEGLNDTNFFTRTKNVRFQWLMCFDDFKTHVSKIGDMADRNFGVFDNIESIASRHGYKVTNQTLVSEKTMTLYIGTGTISEGPGKEERGVVITAPDGRECWIKLYEYKHMMADIEDYLIFRFSKHFTFTTNSKYGHQAKNTKEKGD